MRLGLGIGLKPALTTAKAQEPVAPDDPVYADDAMTQPVYTDDAETNPLNSKGT